MRTLLLFLLSMSLPGCWWLAPSWDGDAGDDDDDDGWSNEDDDWEASDTDDPPELSVDVGVGGNDGVMGPDDTIAVFVDDDDTETLDVSFRFALSVRRDVDRGGSTTITGAEIGEGYGDLQIQVSDADGGNTSTAVEGLLVDLTPPSIEMEPCILAANGKGDRGTMAAWIGDAWALGDVTLVVAPQDGLDLAPAVFTETFASWPATFGESWDWSFFSVSAAQLPAGSSTATYTVRDRAGNTTSRSCDLFVDGSPPVVTLAATLVDDEIQVDATAVDDDAAFSLVLHAGGVEVAHGAPPSTRFVLDAADFASGELALEARATDRAGNEGRSQVVVLDIP